MKIDVNLAELMPVIQVKLSQGEKVRFTPNGNSMRPLLIGGKSLVTVEPIPSKLKKNDIVLYKRSNGRYILHRIISVNKDDTYHMCGDNQSSVEKFVKYSQLIGVVTAFKRKKREYYCSNKALRFCSSVWVFLRPVRRLVYRAEGLFNKKNIR